MDYIICLGDTYLCKWNLRGDIERRTANTRGQSTSHCATMFLFYLVVKLSRLVEQIPNFVV